MNALITRRKALAGLMAGTATGLAAPALANAPLSSLRPRVRPANLGVPKAEDIVARAQLGGVTTYAVARADGTLLEAAGAEAPVPPASVAKAVTALYALDTLGENYRFETVLMGSGPIVDGVLQGDLILKGTGDPIFDTDALGGLTSALQEAGLTAITGAFYVDGHDLPAVDEIDPGQPIHAGYNPSVSGLNLNYNRVHFEWRKQGAGYALTMDARARKYQPSVASATMRAVDSGSPVYTHRLGEAREHWTVARPALGNGGARWLPVRRPLIYAGDVFRSLAAGKNIALPEAKIANRPLYGTVLARHGSPSLRGLCGGMLRYSTNLTAEVLGMRATQARGARPETLAASAHEMSGWVAERFGAYIQLVDHSGLGDSSRVTCAALVKMLDAADGLDDILKSIAVKDANGAVVNGAGHSIRAKTGTLNFVNSLAGYVTPKGGAPLTFAIVSADLPRRAAIPSGDRDRPAGARSYARRARLVQQALIARWVALSSEA